MKTPYFSNVDIDHNFEHFFFVGELKAYGLNHFVGQALKRMFHTRFRPISVAPDLIDPTGFENLAVINPDAADAEKEAGRKVAFRTPSAPFSARVSESSYINTMIEELLNKQEQVFVWMFESRPELKLGQNGQVKLLGPDADLTEGLNDKTWQYQTFSKVAPVVDFRVCSGTDGLRKGLEELEPNCPYGMFVSASHSAGGAQSMVASSIQEALDRFTTPDADYLISSYMPHEYDPTVLAVVGNENDVYVAGVADMNIVDGNKFRGSTFPSVLPKDIQKKLRDYTAAIGRELGKLGFKGIYGCDYIVTKDGDIYFIEVNPRKQGTTMEFCSALERLLPEGAPSLFDLECHAVLNGGFPDDTLEPDYDSIIDGSLHWGTFNHKVEQDVITGTMVPQEMDEREIFARVAKEGTPGHIVMEHVGTDVLVRAGTFLGRTAAVGATREAMLKELEQGTKRLADSIAQSV